MKQQIEVGNVIVVRDFEPALRLTGIVTGLEDNDKFVRCVMLTMHRKFRLGRYVYEFQSLETDYVVAEDQKIEVLMFPGDFKSYDLKKAMQGVA